MPEDVFAGGKEVKPGRFQWGKVGDYIIGYFTSTQEAETENGTKKLYELKAISGLYHEVETTNDENGNKVVTVAEEGTILEAGDYFSIWGRDDVDRFFQKAKVGQKVGVQFKEIIPSKKKGYSPYKVLKTVMWDEYEPSAEEQVADTGM